MFPPQGAAAPWGGGQRRHRGIFSKLTVTVTVTTAAATVTPGQMSGDIMINKGPRFKFTRCHIIAMPMPLNPTDEHGQSYPADGLATRAWEPLIVEVALQHDMLHLTQTMPPAKPNQGAP